MDYNLLNDNQLIELIHEEDEEAKNILLEKYHYIIDTEVRKYVSIAKRFGYEMNDLYQDALVGFTDALYNYRSDKKSKLSSFITLCVDRKLQVCVRNAATNKNKTFQESLSLESTYGKINWPLKDLLSDNRKNDPLENILKEEDMVELTTRIKKELSKSEYEVYNYMIQGLKYDEIATLLGKNLKQVDNTMQRIKWKIKKILEER